MHIHFLDPYQEGRSLVHLMDPRIKLVLALAFILATALTPTGAWPAIVLLLALILCLELLSELGILFFLKRAVLAAPFMLAALPLLVTVPGSGLLALPFGLTVSAPGLARFVSLALKSWISVQMAILLASTTRFPEILFALRALRLPRLLVAITGLMWRYLFVMADEALRLARARQARSGALSESGSRMCFTFSVNGGASPPIYRKLKPQSIPRPGGSVAWRGKVTGGMAGSLFIRSLERSDRIYQAMLSRGYNGEIRSLPHPPITASGWLALAGGLSLLGFILWIGNIR